MQMEKGMMMMSDEMQKIADRIKSDVEKELNQTFKKFQVMESETLMDESDPKCMSYKMKIKTDDNNQSNLCLRTTRRDPQSNFMTTIDDFFRGMSPFENMLNMFDSSRTGCSSIQKLADRIKCDVEKSLNRSFGMFDVMEFHPIMTDKDHTSYYMRIKTDDNGHVRVKTIKKEPGSDWKTHVEEYQRGKPTIEGEKKPGLESGERARERIEGKGKEKMEVEEGQQSKTATA